MVRWRQRAHAITTTVQKQNVSDTISGNNGSAGVAAATTRRHSYKVLNPRRRRRYNNCHITFLALVSIVASCLVRYYHGGGLLLLLEKNNGRGSRATNAADASVTNAIYNAQPQRNHRKREEEDDDETSASSITAVSNTKVLYTIPDKPDLSIGTWLRDEIIRPKSIMSSISTPSRTGDPNSHPHPHPNPNPLSACSPTSQLRISTRIDQDGNDGAQQSTTTNTTTRGPWILEALDEQGNKKSVGGDEFFITYTDDHNHNHNQHIHSQAQNGSQISIPIPTAVAITTDNHDGTYDLEFVSGGFGSIPNGEGVGAGPGASVGVGVGSIRISIVFTCGIGRMTRPTKDEWVTGGHLYPKEQYTYHISNVTAPPIRTVRLPNTSPHGNRSGGNNGTRELLVDLSKHDKVICFGDSLLRNLCGKFPKPLYRQMNMEISSMAGALVRSDILGIAMEFLDEIHGADLNRTIEDDVDVDVEGYNNDAKANNMSKSMALIVNSANWELEGNAGPFPGHYFNDTLQMYYDYVRSIRERYPHVTLYWKSPQAIHPTALSDSCYKKPKCKRRVRYASLSSVEYLYWEQKRIMEELDVPFLDLWEISYVSEWGHKPGDAAHYTPAFNAYLLDFFYPESMSLSNTSAWQTDYNDVTSIS